jgi:polysaccharide export outer membrane protein
LSAYGLWLALLISAALVAQDVQDQRAIEPTPQSVDVPQEDASPVVPPALEAIAPSTDYVIGPEDVLDIDVFNVPELTKTVRVANDGTISLALLGRVPAAGLTTTQLREELESKWSQTYLENPQVSVFVREFHAQPVSVIGPVEKPGLYQLTGPRTLVEMLSMAGGLAKRNSAPAGRTVHVTRKGGFADLQLAEGVQLVAPDKVEIDLQRLLYSHDDALNIEIKPLDIISVSKADVVYVVGEVKRAGGFVLEDRERITVLQALAMAEGLTGAASGGSARIIRRSQDGSRVEIPVDLSKVLKGKSPDVELAANDILFVPTSTAKAAAKRGAEAAIGTISGILIYRRW